MECGGASLEEKSQGYEILDLCERARIDCDIDIRFKILQCSYLRAGQW